MSRFKRFTHSMLSSYLFLGVNVMYTLASVPLALKYLSKAEFGLWAVSLQIAGYISLVDLGMSGSISRILIDHKDERAGGRYGSTILSGLLVSLTQAFIVLVVGLSLVWFMADWLLVPQELSRQFLWLMIGQIGLTAGMFGTRIFNQLLYAWQRMDISYYSQIVQLIVGFGVLWMGFYLGWGVFSLLVGLAAGWLVGTAFCWWACHHFGFWPKRGEWGRASRERFGEFFRYGADILWVTIGVQLIMSSQTVLVSRQLGLETAALWSVMTKAFTVISQIVLRIVGNAMPAFAEMHVRGENERMWRRYQAMFITVSVFSGVCGVLFAACNGPFVNIWMHGKFSWPAMDNVLLGLWLIVSAQQCCHNSLIINLKEIRGLKYIFLIEGCVFVGVALVLLPSKGITGMLICSLAATTLFTWLCSAWRVVNLSGMGWKPFLRDWQRPLFWVVGLMTPCWLGMEWLLQSASDWVRLAVNGSVLTVIGVFVALRFALPPELVAEFVGKLPAPLQAAAAILSRPFRQAGT